MMNAWGAAEQAVKNFVEAIRQRDIQGAEESIIDFGEDSEQVRRLGSGDEQRRLAEARSRMSNALIYLQDGKDSAALSEAQRAHEIMTT